MSLLDTMTDDDISRMRHELSWLTAQNEHLIHTLKHLRAIANVASPQTITKVITETLEMFDHDET